jgi:hypothetical protein
MLDRPLRIEPRVVERPAEELALRLLGGEFLNAISGRPKSGRMPREGGFRMGVVRG